MTLPSFFKFAALHCRLVLQAGVADGCHQLFVARLPLTVALRAPDALGLNSYHITVHKLLDRPAVIKWKSSSTRRCSEGILC